MANISVTYTFSNGNVIDASQINQNFTDILNGTSDGNSDFSINALTVAGALTANGAVTLGNASSDDLTFTGSMASTLPVKTTYSYDIGSSTIGLRKIYLGSDDSGAFTTYLEAGTNSASYGLKLPDADGSALDYMQTDGSGQLAFVGGPSTTAKTTTYTATKADKFLTVSTSSAWTLTLYDPTTSGNENRFLKILKTSSDTNVLTIADSAGGELISGSGTTTVAQQYECLTLYNNGTTWYIIDRTYPGTQSWTPTASWSTNCTWTGYWYRLGEYAHISARVVLSGGAHSGGVLSINMPTGLTIDTAKTFANGQDRTLGIANAFESGVDAYAAGHRVYYSTTSAVKIIDDDGGTAADYNNSVPFSWNDGDEGFFKWSVPIVGWSA